MSDNLTATVTQSTDFSVSAVGIQGLSASDSNLEMLNNVDASNLQDGSLLIYKTGTSKWTASTLLDQQSMEGGEF